MHSKKIIGAIAFSVITAAALTACGGGGGSAGDTNERYEIDMQVMPRSVLYTTPETGYARRGNTYNANFEAEIILHVRKGDGDLAPDGTSVSCHVDGVGVGGFVDADSTTTAAATDAEPQCDAATTVPSMTYTTSVTTAAGVHRMHFHTGNTPTCSPTVTGVLCSPEARIVCRVIDPRDGRSHEAVQELTILPALSWADAVTPEQQNEYAEAVGCTVPAAPDPNTTGGTTRGTTGGTSP